MKEANRAIGLNNGSRTFSAFLGWGGSGFAR